MAMTLPQLQELLHAKENEHLEFKEAKNNFDFDTLVKYCAAIANEGGGKMVLGVTDQRPRRVVGSHEFANLERTKAGIIECLHLRIEADELQHPNGRVLVFEMPARPIGVPIPYKGAYWMRAGEDLVPMTPDKLKRIFDEAVPDYTAEVCEKATIDDLAPAAIQEFRQRWQRKSGNEMLGKLSDERLLSGAELIVGGKITFAALILLGTRQALGRYLAQAEVIFEYRSNEAPGPAQQREEYRQSFLLFFDDLWKKINLRNDLQHFQDGFYMNSIPTFNEIVCREAILNAVSHRDYRHPGSIFVKQFPRRLEIISPGGFPLGITPQNIISEQLPRNRRLAESFARCGLVERAGQGADLMFGWCIKESKPHPDYSQTNEHRVWMKLNGEIQDPHFLRFLEKIGAEKLSTFVIEDLLVLDLIHREQRIPRELKPRVAKLLDEGVIERAGGGKFLLARGFYDFIGRKGVYTRKRGLDKETNKALLLKHIRDHQEEGSKLSDLMEVLPSHSRRQVQNLLKELCDEAKIEQRGRTSAGRWYLQNTSLVQV
jgi:ATP-dependent DNA helicase RecG